MSKDWNTRTKLVHEGSRRSQYGEMAEAIFLTQGFVYPDAESAEARFIKAGDDEFIYARYGNPTTRMFEERIAALEGTEDAFATASGMAAVSGALTALLRAGDHVVSSRALFGSCLYILEEVLTRYGVKVTFVDGADLDQWRAAVTPGTKAVFFESMSNPTLELVDIRAVADIAHTVGALVIVDNVFATPIFSKAVEQGADVIVYSGTKHMDGQGRVLGGAIMSTKKFKDEQLKPFLRHTGPSISPFNAWVLLKGLETLKLRVEAQSHSAHKVAAALEAMPGVARVLYPHLDSHPQAALCRKQMTLGGTMVTFEVEGGKKKAFDLLRNLGIIDISNNLGDAKSLMTHPASTTHRNIGPEARAMMGITDGMVRLSVGLEDTSDLIADLTQAMKA